jgi:hypothetical protein
MVKRIVVLGRCGPDDAAEAVNAVVRFVCDNGPDEVVCFERSTSLLERLREVYDGPMGVHRGRVAAARFGATALPAVYDIAPGWISTSVRNSYQASAIAGNTALNAAKRLNTCVVLGHTGRMGIGSHTSGHGGNAPSTLVGMEVGNLLDRKSSRSLDELQGFGMLEVDGEHVEPTVVRISNLNS